MRSSCNSRCAAPTYTDSQRCHVKLSNTNLHHQATCRRRTHLWTTDQIIVSAMAHVVEPWEEAISIGNIGNGCTNFYLKARSINRSLTSTNRISTFHLNYFDYRAEETTNIAACSATGGAPPFMWIIWRFTFVSSSKHNTQHLWHEFRVWCYRFKCISHILMFFPIMIVYF